MVRQKIFRPQFFLFPILAIMTAPAISAVFVLLSVITGGLKFVLPKGVLMIILLMLATFATAFLSVLVNSSQSGEVAESLKFLFMALMLWTGYSSGLKSSQVEFLAKLAFGTVFSWYVIQHFLNFTIPFFYPPDFNNSVILLVFFSFVLTEGRGLVFRLVLIASLVVFSEIARSRTILLFTPIFFISQPISLSFWKLVSLTIVTIGAVIWVITSDAFGSFSDLVRLEIYRNSYTVITEYGLVFLGNGPHSFTSDVNAILPPFISDRLEIQHAHNALLDVIGSYGLIAGATFLLFWLRLLWLNMRTGNESLRNQVLVLMLLMTIESAIGDSRIMYAIFLFLGMQIAANDTNLKTSRAALKSQTRPLSSLQFQK